MNGAESRPSGAILVRTVVMKARGVFFVSSREKLFLLESYTNFCQIKL